MKHWREFPVVEVQTNTVRHQTRSPSCGLYQKICSSTAREFAQTSSPSPLLREHRPDPSSARVHMMKTLGLQTWLHDLWSLQVAATLLHPSLQVHAVLKFQLNTSSVDTMNGSVRRNVAFDEVTLCCIRMKYCKSQLPVDEWRQVWSTWLDLAEAVSRPQA